MTDLEKALQAGARPIESDYERAMKAGAKPIAAKPADAAPPAEPGFLERNVNAVKNFAKHPLDETMREVNGLGDFVGVQLGNAANTITGGGMRFLRNLPATVDNIKSGDAKRIIFGNPQAQLDPVSQHEDQYNAEHPAAATVTNAAASLLGAPQALAKSAGVALGGLTARAPAAVARVLATRPAQGLVGGALVGGAQQVASDVSQGAPPSLSRTLHSGLTGGAIGLAGGLAGVGIDKIAASKGAKAVRTIEQSGQGATSGPLSPGTGGVYDRELAGVPANDRGIGMAGKRGAENILNAVETEHEAATGLPYRGNAQTLRDTRQQAAGAIKTAERAVDQQATLRAGQITDAIAADHRAETSRPYQVMKAQIDNSPAGNTARDAGPVVARMRDAVHDLDTSSHARTVLDEQLRLLENFRDPQSQAVMVPERQLNGLRRTLMRAAKVGTTDSPGEAEAPLRAAAFAAKRMVDEGPYASLNQFYNEGTNARTAARQSVGLKAKLPRDAGNERKALAGTLKRSVADPSLVEGYVKGNPSGQLADMSKARADLASAAAIEPEMQYRVKGAEERAAPTRQQLGLGSKAGERKADVNQLRLALQRQTEQTTTAGGAPGDLAAFRAAHPDLALQMDLPKLANARADLSYRVIPQHGGMFARGVGTAIGPGAAWLAANVGHATRPQAIATGLGILGLQNATPIVGRLLYPATRGLRHGAPPPQTGLAAPLVRGAFEDKDKRRDPRRRMEQRQ